MSVTLRVSKADIAKAEQKGSKARQASVAAVVMAARRDSEPYVPYLDGHLRRSAETESQPEKALLKYGSAAVPYARPQYFGCPHKNWPGTTMRWFERAKEAHLPGWIQEAQSAAKEAVR